MERHADLPSAPAGAVPPAPVAQETPRAIALVVDDSRVQRRILAAALARWGYEVVEAESGEAALDHCMTTHVDFVLSDWMMPGMSGLDLCRAFREMPRASYGYFILLTSKSDKQDVAEGLSTGADDYLTKPVNPVELRARMEAGLRILSMERELSTKNRLIGETLAELQRVYDEIDRDLIQAKAIQASLVPVKHARFGNSAVSLLIHPCGHVGGDLVGMFSPSPDRLGVYSIDVSGHGITSAMMTARVSGYLSNDFPEQNVAMRALGNDRYDMRAPQEVARLLNERLTHGIGVSEYFTMAYASADLFTGRVRMVQAGHPHPLLIRADGSCEFLGAGGVPVGLVPVVDYDDFECSMQPGDRLLLYSDGFTECVLADGQMLEPEGLVRLVQDMPPDTPGPEFLEDLYWRLTQMMGPDRSLDDDVSAALFDYRTGASGT